MYGQLVIKGFFGQSPRDTSVRQVRHALEKSLIGGVIFFHKNIRNPKQVEALTQYFRQADTPYTPVIAVDEEGGAVERLNRRKGFTYTPGHWRMQQRNDLQKARTRYDGMAAELAKGGLQHQLRAGGGPQAQPQQSDHRAQAPLVRQPPTIRGALCLRLYRSSRRPRHWHALKHWPGHGSSASDSHLRFVDVTKQWKPVEIEPYRRLFRSGFNGMVMTSHLYHKDWGMGQGLPASLSPVAIKTRLRDELGFDGVVITDDLQMRAITSRRPLDTGNRSGAQGRQRHGADRQCAGIVAQQCRLCRQCHRKGREVW
jgi:beta-N-acetylhexosaminidase